jgi:hypothetical protein
LTKEYEEASLVEGVYTEVACFLGSTSGTFLFVEESETNIGIVGLVYVTETRWVCACKVKEGSSGRLGVAVSNAEREWAPVSVSAVLEKDAAVKRTDGNYKASAEPSARGSNGNNGKELKDTISYTDSGGGWNTRVGELTTLGVKWASIVGYESAVSILLNNINEIVVDQVLNDDTSRVNNKSIVEVRVVGETTGS